MTEGGDKDGVRWKPVWILSLTLPSPVMTAFRQAVTETCCSLSSYDNSMGKQQDNNIVSSFFFLYVVSNFSTLKTLLVNAGLFGCFRNPRNSDMDCRIFNVRM